LVREFESEPKSADFQGNLSTLTLEYYPEMTEKLLAEIIQQSFDRWPLIAVSVVHRVGSLKPNDQIVFVGVASEHRLEAFQAAQFLMDYLKTRATFWKKIEMNGQSHWAEAKVSDNVAATKWEG
jgi:molybdopterin synthase catalytic subunit